MDESSGIAREAVIKKIVALMAKTTAAGCSKEEAMMAADKVRELLNKYQLDLSDLEIKESKCAQDHIDTGLKGTQMIELVVVAIGKFTDCKVWRSTGNHDFVWYNFFGLEHHVEVAKYIYKVCDWAILWEWEDWKRGPGKYKWQASDSKNKNLLKQSFQQGIAQELSRRLIEMKIKEREQNVASTGRDLVVVVGQVVTEEFAKLNLRLSKTKSHARDHVHDGAYNAGTEAGKRVALNPGVRQNSNSTGGLLK